MQNNKRYDELIFMSNIFKNQPHEGKLFPMRRLLPSMVTLLSLASGMTAIRFALMGKFEGAVVAIMIASILDIMDGRIAILFKATSKFGAELDSLSDLVSFGVAPAFTMYIWTLSGGGTLGWLAALLLVICGALRLARYNTLPEDVADDKPKIRKTFLGVPIPGAAGLALMPLICSIAWDIDLSGQPRLTAIWVIIISLLMVSRLPTLALKGWRVPAPFVLPLLVLVAILAASLVTDPFMTLSVIGLGYAALLPSFYLWQRRQKNQPL